MIENLYRNTKSELWKGYQAYGWYLTKIILILLVNDRLLVIVWLWYEYLNFKIQNNYCYNLYTYIQ